MSAETVDKVLLFVWLSKNKAFGLALFRKSVKRIEYSNINPRGEIGYRVRLLIERLWVQVPPGVYSVNLFSYRIICLMLFFLHGVKKVPVYLVLTNHKKFVVFIFLLPW